MIKIGDRVKVTNKVQEIGVKIKLGGLDSLKVKEIKYNISKDYNREFDLIKVYKDNDRITYELFRKNLKKIKKESKVRRLDSADNY